MSQRLTFQLHSEYCVALNELTSMPRASVVWPVKWESSRAFQGNGEASTLPPKPDPSSGKTRKCGVESSSLSFLLLSPSGS